MECRCNQIQSSQKAKKYHKDMLFCFSPAFSGQDTAVTQVTSTMSKKEQIDTDNSGPFMFDHLEPEWPSDPSGDGEPQTTVLFFGQATPRFIIYSLSAGSATGTQKPPLTKAMTFSGLKHKNKTEPLTQSYIPTSSHFHHIFFCTNHIKSQPLSFTSPSPHP